MIHWVNTHGLMCLIIYWFVSSAVSTLPTPSGKNAFYQWFFNFLHVFGSNLMRIPQVRGLVGQNQVNKNANGTL